MITDKTLTKFGLTKDEDNLKLKEVFKNGSRLKEIHIDIYSENPLVESTAPFMLLSRVIENDIRVTNDDDRLILKKNSGFEICFMNILFSKITECCYKIFDNYSEIIINIQNIYFKITILN